jgi:hypothetical protein
MSKPRGVCIHCGARLDIAANVPTPEQKQGRAFADRYCAKCVVNRPVCEPIVAIPAPHVIAFEESLVAQWFVSGLTEREARELIGAIPGTLAYGAVKSYALLPEDAKRILRARFAEVSQ